MEPREIAATYDRIAGHWAAPDFNARNGLAAHERALGFCPRTGAALDVGCGANGRFIALLRERGFTPEGLDISPEMLAHARRRHPDLAFHRADICTWVPARRYDFITAWDSVWHVLLDRQTAVIAKLCGALAPGGVLIFTAGGLDGPHEVTNPCHGEPLYHATPGIPALSRTLAESGCVLRHLEFDQLPEKHLVIVAQRPVA